MQVKLIFTRKVVLLASFWKWGFLELGSGLSLMISVVQLNLSTTATLGTEESGRCREVLNKSQCMDFLSAWTKNCGRCREVDARGGFDLILAKPTQFYCVLPMKPGIMFFKTHYKEKWAKLRSSYVVLVDSQIRSYLNSVTGRKRTALASKRTAWKRQKRSYIRDA